ncbi:uncharacterized protein LOC141601549 [Silene latifolia]|uniref:uncharacterized protein LOC141601549 n=1 Tax=Silene latifolia TaxID=37657 RepID=UPI003D773716
MEKGRVPFKYLGVSVSPKRLSVLDCDCLVAKVTDRIRAMGSRHLSYAGRAVSIKSIFSTLHNHWARISILPKTVLRKIGAICREFLWHGKESRDNTSLVAWEKECRPKKQRDLGFKNLILWNVATLTKYVWWIENKEDHLWVKWVHAVYIKDQQSHTSQNVKYTVRLGYSWLLPDVDTVTCHKCCELVSELCRFRIPLQHCVNWWIDKRFRSLCQKKILGVILAALIYHIWMGRNRSRVELFLCRPERVLQLIQKDVILRL